jgi:hypothetical protein
VIANGRPSRLPVHFPPIDGAMSLSFSGRILKKTRSVWEQVHIANQYALECCCGSMVREHGLSGWSRNSVAIKRQLLAGLEAAWQQPTLIADRLSPIALRVPLHHTPPVPDHEPAGGLLIATANTALAGANNRMSRSAAPSRPIHDVEVDAGQPVILRHCPKSAEQQQTGRDECDPLNREFGPFSVGRGREK